MTRRYFGAQVMRLEDPRLLTGGGQYVDDIVIPGTLQAGFVRSIHAHAKINSIDMTAARDLPGVIAVYTLDDLGPPFSEQRMPQVYPNPNIIQSVTAFVLAKDEVNYVGHPVVMVVADSRAIAEDAAALVKIEYQPLAPIVDCGKALADDAPMAHEGLTSNLAAQVEAKFGDIDAAFKNAKHVLKTEFHQHRGGCHSMEGRGVLAEYNERDGGFTIYSSAQAPYMVRHWVAEFFGLDDNNVRVIAPDVGGGFGPKAGLYPEDFLIPLAARMLGRPVKWIEDRREHFITMNQQGDQVWSLEVAVEDDGRLLGVRGRAICDMGAHAAYGLLLPMTSVFPLPGPYDFEALDVELDCVLTNTTSKSPVRGAGRPNAAYAIERVMEVIARELKLDPAQVRKTNFVKKEQFPFEPGTKLPNGTPVVYDSGDYHGCLDKVIELADYDGFRERQAQAREQGRYLGIGMASCIEDTGMGPFEGVTVRVLASGQVVLQTGAASQGQGHETVFSQIVADELGVDVNDIIYGSADTGKFPIGIGTGASRVIANAGPAARDAAVKVRAKALEMAAVLFETQADELEIEDGIVKAKDPERNLQIPLGEVAGRLAPRMGALIPGGMEPGLDATSYKSSDAVPHASGSAMVEVEVDIGTGDVKLLKYSASHDCGNMINPLLVDGQIIGGVIHGIGNALFERMVYDDAGQPLSTNYGEYLLPIATEMPPIEIAHLQNPSPFNELGVKGAGEGGTIPAANAIVAAIENALEPFGVVIDAYPIEPPRLCELIDAAAG